MQRYRYSGPVMEFGRCVDNRWTGETLAKSEGEARRNLVWQWKKQNGRAPTARVQLADKVQVLRSFR